MPSAALPPAVPLTSHETVAPAARQNEAVDACDVPSEILADAGEIAAAALQPIMAVAVPDFVASATLVAAIVTVAGDGATEGAV